MNLGALIADGTLALAIPIALVAGFVSFLSPCVLPLVPGYLGFIGAAVAPREPRRVPVPETAARAVGSAGSAIAGSVRTATEVPERAERAEGPSRGRLLGGVALFVAGFTLVFMAVTILGGTVGLFFLEHGALITRIMGVVVILLGLVFIGLFGVAQRTIRPHLQGNLGLIGAPLLGITLGIGWTPCIGPTLGAIITLSWNLGDPGRAALLGLAYSAGLGIPFFLIALGFGWATKSVAFLRRHIRAVNIIGGALLVLLGILMVSGVWTTIMSRLQGVMANVPLPI